MRYTSLEDIKSEFNLSSLNEEEMRAELNELRIKLHPDKNAGSFKSENEKEVFYNINDAIEYIDNKKDNNTSLVVVEKMNDLIKVMVELIPSNKEIQIQAQLDFRITRNNENNHRINIVPKATLAIISALVTFLYLFPGQ